MHVIIEDFSSTWSHLRTQLTYDFVDGVPDAHWEATPHPRYRAFNKQVRHLVCVQGVYLQGLTGGSADFANKHSHYGGPLDRASLRAALREKDAELDAALAAIDRSGAEAFEIDWFGSRIGLGRYLDVVIQHEAIHHGQWSFYATLAGYETPVSWRLNWGL